MPTEPKPFGTVFEVPVRMTSSHNIAQPGFQSDRQGELWNAEVDLEKQPLTIVDLKVLGVDLSGITIRKRDAEWYLMRIQFAGPLTMDDAGDFIRRLSEAFTASLAVTQRDPWYGNLGLEVGWAGLRDQSPKAPNTIAIIDSVGLQSIERIAVDKQRLTALQWSPLAAIFVEGMRAAQPKPKFLFWFVILEELEGFGIFDQLFTPLFVEAEKEALLKANISAAAKQRLRQLLNNPKATFEGRPLKLLKILQHIGLSKVVSLQGDIPITEEICRSLINQRNTVAHKGSMINEDQLYTVLFPLAQGALKYIMQDDEASSYVKDLAT